jgi:hypothetical protein
MIKFLKKIWNWFFGKPVTAPKNGGGIGTPKDGDITK